MHAHTPTPYDEVETLLGADAWAREHAERYNGRQAAAGA